MKQRVSAGAKRLAWLFAALYFASYVMRINFAVMLVRICSDMSLPKTELAVVLTALTVTYGVGQVIAGFLGDRIEPRILLTVGLAAAVLCNGAMTFVREPWLMSVIWAINGMAHALLWPPILRQLSTRLSDEDYNYAVVRVSWGSSGATLLLYLCCPLLLGFLSWRSVMWICAAVGASILLFWLIVGKRWLDAVPVVEHRKISKTANGKKDARLPAYVVLPVVLIALGILSQGALRDGVTNWMPSYLSESFGLAEENAIIAAVIPAVTSIVSFTVAAYVQKRWIQNEVLCAAATFGAAAVCSLVLFLINTLLSPILPRGVSLGASVAAMSLIIGAMHGINLMLITIVPKRFAKLGRVSTYSGILNACTYVGAALSNYGFALIAERVDWGTTVLTWIVICLLGAVVCLSAVGRWERFRRD